MMLCTVVVLLTLGATGEATSQAAVPHAGKFFAITVVDDQSGRGVPLVELSTTNSIRYYTDSNGVVAFYEPGLMGRRVFFTVKSHGYEFPKDGFGITGQALEIAEGGSATLKIKRVNIAERLYRMTGQGIYRDSVLLGRPVPTAEPVINGLVMGQDSVLNVIYQGKLFWFWGDTGWPAYPLGNFKASGATSLLPGQGGLDPDVGANLTYFVDEKTGFARGMVPMPESNPVWPDGFITLPDETGRERMFAFYARVTPAMETIERGLVCWNDEKEVFEKVAQFELKAPMQPQGHPFKHKDRGVEYVYHSGPFPLIRVRADAKAIADPANYEGYTCLKDGGRLDSPEIDRDAGGTVRYAWRKNTPPLGTKEQTDFVKQGLLKAEETLLQLQDTDTGKAVVPHSGSVFWNEFRKRWITIRCEVFGTSMLGETWYAEADTPVGPWVYARKIVTHDKYSFYNPKQHPYFDREGGRIIYFEGTYTYTFSGNTDPTPRYDYNQIMYKLDLADARLSLPVAVYDVSAGEVPARFATLRDLEDEPGKRRIAFFAPDRPGAGTVPVYGGRGLTLAGTGDPLFHALPADVADPPATTVPLYEFVPEKQGDRAYTTDASWSREGYRRSDKPVCRVWRNPMALGLP